MGPPPAGARLSLGLEILSAAAFLGGVTLLCLAALDWVAYDAFLVALLRR